MEHVVHMTEMRNLYILVEVLKEKGHSDDIVVNGKNIKLYPKVKWCENVHWI